MLNARGHRSGENWRGSRLSLVLADVLNARGHRSGENADPADGDAGYPTCSTLEGIGAARTWESSTVYVEDDMCSTPEGIGAARTRSLALSS